MFSLNELKQATELVHRFIPETPQYQWPLLANRLRCQVWVKHENHTPVGAFKVRGGLVFIQHLMQSQHDLKGIVSATRGNHGQSLAFAAAKVGLPVYIVVPEGNCSEKNAAMRALGAHVIESGVDFDEARAKAKDLAEQNNWLSVPPFHPDLILGVATYAFELFNAVSDIDTVYVPIGMGSGICALIQVRNLLGLKTKIVGVVAQNADAFAQSFEKGEIVTTATANTIADGLACRMPLPEAFAVIKAGAERIVRVDEECIRQAICAYHEDTHNIAEGAGAAALAALIKEQEQQQGKKIGVILSGGNIDRALYSQLLSQE
ncbi:threonine dehydratase [Neisseria sp. Ec49-e6-T10]|uniref:threonine dehydratase n=1 Tax=Neisseria sp. Ec49-e6-T10 TaxID=3140744 RepID=UPI003EBFDF8F